MWFMYHSDTIHIYDTIFILGYRLYSVPRGLINVVKEAITWNLLHLYYQIFQS